MKRVQFAQPLPRANVTNPTKQLNENEVFPHDARTSIPAQLIFKSAGKKIIEKAFNKIDPNNKLIRK